MEELNKFFWLLKKRRLTLIIIPFIAIIITFFLVRNLPDVFVSQARISTGIIDETQQLFSDEIAPQTQEVNQEFSNLVEMMRMKKILDQVSYQVILHDITSKTPFRQYSRAIKDLTPGAKKHAIEVFRNKYQRTEGLNLWDKDQNGLYNVLRSMGYDSESLIDKLRINRAGDSDFINIEFEAENPELAAFIANTHCTEFIKYYTFLVKANQRKAADFLGNLLNEKNRVMNDKIAALRNYKIKNRVLNLNEQSSQLYKQILEYDTRRQQAIKDISSYSGTLGEIDRKFNPGERQYLEATLTTINQKIISTREELRALYDQYIQSGFEDTYKSSIDSLQNILTAQISRSSDQYINNPLNTKQELIQQKLTLEIQLDLVRYSMGSMEKEQQKLNAEFDKLVPHEAVVQSLERDVDVASKEYLDILNKYNQSSMEAGLSVKMNQVQTAMPGLALPSKKMLLVILSGIISFVFCMVILFILFYLDRSIKDAKELANKTQSPVLGHLIELTKSVSGLTNIWDYKGTDKHIQEFKDLLRSVRFEIDKELNGKILAISSINQHEGKTLLALNLAFAWKMTNKRILIIDGNFNHPEISRSAEPGIYIEDYLSGKNNPNQFRQDTLIHMIGNRGGNISVLEISDEKTIREKLGELKDKFDLIIIETAALVKLNQATEWFLFADNIVAVFEANQTISLQQKQYISYLKSQKNLFTGWVLNKVFSGTDNNSLTHGDI